MVSVAVPNAKPVPKSTQTNEYGGVAPVGFADAVPSQEFKHEGSAKVGFKTNNVWSLIVKS